MTEEVVSQALALWHMDDADAELAAQRENTVWRVRWLGRDYALRCHRPGYRSAPELRSELQWMSHLADAGLAVPEPFPLPDGRLVGLVDERHVSLLTWLPGHPIGALGRLHEELDPASLGYEMGRMMARLHDVSDAWDLPTGFTRPDWRRNELLGPDPLWGRFWEHPDLDAGQREILERARTLADGHLGEIENDADQGLIHADLLTENVLMSGDGLAFLDFDDGAVGFRDFEIATFLGKFVGSPIFETLRTATCDGYAIRRTVDPHSLDLFLLLRALTYPGWIMSRLNEPGAAQRSARAVASALAAVETYLKGRTS